jgi:hypothetical protein
MNVVKELLLFVTEFVTELVKTIEEDAQVCIHRLSCTDKSRELGSTHPDMLSSPRDRV